MQATVRALLLGLPLLRLDATVVLAPAPISASSSVVGGASLEEAVRQINEGAQVLEDLRHNGRR